MCRPPEAAFWQTQILILQETFWTRSFDHKGLFLALGRVAGLNCKAGLAAFLGLAEAINRGKCRAVSLLEYDEMSGATGMAKYVPQALVREIEQAFTGHDDARFRVAMRRDFVGIMLVKGVPFWLWTEAIDAIESYVLHADLTAITNAAERALDEGRTSLQNVDASFEQEVTEAAVKVPLGLSLRDPVLVEARVSLAGMLYQRGYAWVTHRAIADLSGKIDDELDKLIQLNAGPGGVADE